MQLHTRTTGNRRSGQMLVLLCFCLGVLIAVLALAFDGGRLMEQRRRVQIGADFAALAAAIALSQPNASFSDAQDAAWQNAKANGFPNGIASDGTPCTVTVNYPPQDGMFAGNKNYIEVVITSQMPPSFSSFLTSSNLTVRMRSVAAAAPNDVGLLTLDVAASSPLTITGQGQLTVLNGSIFVNSASSTAVTLGGSSRVTALSLKVAGNISQSGNTTLNASRQTGVTAQADPLASLPAPNMASVAVQSISTLSVSSSMTLQPGIYTGGIQLNAGANVTLQPGVYIMNGGGLNGLGGSISGTGVMIYNTGASAGALNLSNSVSVNLTPPTSGTYAGILFFQDRTSTTAATITAKGTLNLNGTLYLPKAGVSLSSQAVLNDRLGSIIAATVSISGQGKLTVTPQTSTNGTISLVE